MPFALVWFVDFPTGALGSFFIFKGMRFYEKIGFIYSNLHDIKLLENTKGIEVEGELMTNMPYRFAYEGVKISFIYRAFDKRDQGRGGYSDTLVEITLTENGWTFWSKYWDISDFKFGRVNLDKLISQSQNEYDNRQEKCILDAISQTMPSNDYLYLMVNSEKNRVKIGRSKDVKRRLNQIQALFDSEIKVLYKIERKGGTEKHVHELFKTLNIENEWFKFHESIITYFDSLSKE